MTLFLVLLTTSKHTYFPEMYDEKMKHAMIMILRDWEDVHKLLLLI